MSKTVTIPTAVLEQLVAVIEKAVHPAVPFEDVFNLLRLVSAYLYGQREGENPSDKLSVEDDTSQEGSTDE